MSSKRESSKDCAGRRGLLAWHRRLTLIITWSSFIIAIVIKKIVGLTLSWQLGHPSSSFIITKDDILVIRVFQSWISAANSQPKHSEEESTCDFQLLESFGARIVRPSGKFCINLCFKIIQRTILEYYTRIHTNTLLSITHEYTRIHLRIVHTV